MNNKFRIVSAMCIVVIFTVVGVLGSYMSDLINLTDTKENIEEDTPIERAIEAGTCDFCNMEQNKEPVLAQTPVQQPVPLSAPQASPEIGIVAVLAILSAIYIGEKKR
jgi:hypothetical protein